MVILKIIQDYPGIQVQSFLKLMLSIPIGSMYGIYANIGGILMVNVTIYSSTMDPMGFVGPLQFLHRSGWSSLCFLTCNQKSIQLYVPNHTKPLYERGDHAQDIRETTMSRLSHA